jgi:hypothetical protein
MGAWGDGNFQDDETLDWLEETVLDPLVKFIEDNISTRDGQLSKKVVAAVEVLVVLLERFHQPPPGLRRVTRLRDAYLAAWERTDHGCPVTAFLTERRKVIEKTFADLIAYSGQWEDLDDYPEGTTS